MPTYYAQTIFAKPLDQITEADLTSYFQQERDETLNLEFKSYTDKPGDQRGQAAKDAEKIKGVLKTISAFLNSSGGLLIWGAPESVEVNRGDKKVKMCRGALAPVPKFIDRADFVNKIAGQISPVPAGVRMQPVQVTGGYVYLFDVPESQNKPHQNDGRYYVRMDTRTDAAPHYLVYALCHQIKTPVLSMRFNAPEYTYVQQYTNVLAPIDATVVIKNTTPFINERDLYLFIKSETLQFSNDRHGNEPINEFHIQNPGSLLSMGLEFFLSIRIFLYINLNQAEHTFSMWYGGAKSNVTQANFSLKVAPTGNNNGYSIDIKLVEELGLDRLNV